MKKLCFAISWLITCTVVFASCGESKTVNPNESGKTQSVNISLGEKKASNSSDASSIFAVKNTNGRDDGISRLIELMKKDKLYFYKDSTNTSGLIGSEDVVILKINCQWDNRGGTNTDLVRAVINAITGHPDKFKGEIIVADNGQAQYGGMGKGGSMDWANNNALDKTQSVKKIVEEFSKDYRVSAMTWDSITTSKVDEYSKGDYNDGFILGDSNNTPGLQISYPKFKTQYGTYVSFKEGIWDKDKKVYNRNGLKIINMPVLKSHLNYSVTASIKNYMGTTSDKLTNHGAHISVGVGGMGAQMVNTRMPVLNIIDAIWINPNPMRGPMTSYGAAFETDIIAAGTDPAALDYWASKNILMEAAKKLNLSGYETMNPDDTEPGTFGYYLKKSAEEIRVGGYKANTDETKINVFIDIKTK